MGYGIGGGPRGTNNIAELSAAIQGMHYIIDNKIQEDVTLVSDSQYVLGLASGQYTPQKNIELATELMNLVKQLNIKTKWVKGHSQNVFNDVVDLLAKSGKESYER